MLRRAARRGAMLGLLAGVGVAAPAAAFTAPVLYVRQTFAASTDHTPQGDWIALASAPRLTWLGGYEIGYMVQEAGTPHELQHVGLRIDSVPGPLVQPMDATPYCSGQAASVGDIVAIPFPLQFNGSGTYTITVGVGPSSGGTTDCLTPGPATASTTASFSADGSIAPTLVGSPMIFRDKALALSQFSGVRAPDPAGGDADVRCARDATVNADGSVSGKLIVPKDVSAGTSAQIAEQDFGRPGAWTCVARGAGHAIDAQYNDTTFSTPWSAPLRFDVRSDFERVQARISSPHSSHPKITVTPELPEAAAGGTLSFKLRRPVGCKKLGPRRYDYRYKELGTFKARFNTKTATVTLRKPHATPSAITFLIGRLSFGGTRFYTRSTDPALSFLKITPTGSLSFESPQAFPQCPGGF